MRDERLPELDALRGVAVVAVVGLHVSFGFLIAAPRGSGAFSHALALHLLTVLGAPAFVALSMAGLTLGYARAAHHDYGTFLARRIRRIVPAYVFWTLLTLLRDDPAALVAPGVLTRHLLTGSAAYHLYFVPLICAYYVLWPLLARLATFARRGAASAAAIVVAGIVAMLAVWQAASAGLVANGPLTLPLFWLGYATLGIAAAPAFAERVVTASRGRTRWIAGAALLTLVTAVAWIRHVRGMLGPAPDLPTIALATTIFQRSALAYTLAAMALAAALVGGPARGTALLRSLGRASYGVYLAHVLVLEVVVHRLLGHPRATDFSSPTWMTALGLEWATSLALAWALVEGMARVPGLALVAGMRGDRALTPPARAP